MPDKFRYTEENPYVSDGGGRNSVKGKEYVGVEADVAEFEDLFFNKAFNGGILKAGLGIDEYCDACIQFARKNYADLMPDGKVKKVGNTIKSRKMSGYLEKFIDNAVILLLHDEGAKFIEAYYDYIAKIYNYQIPIKDIASKGNIKKTIKEYIDDCNTVTKAGSKKSRQAWYELVIKNNVKVNVSDTIYYINTGTKKGHSDVKRVTHQFIKDKDGNEVELIGKIKSALFNEYAPKYGVTKGTELTNAQKKEIIAKNLVREEDEIVLNCQMVPPEIINSDEDVLCSDVDGLEYNSEKYISQFNNRVTPLLVCFSPEIRDKILVTNPDDRQYFTEEEAKLVSGFPMSEGDQDTYEALMTPERKEIAFWKGVGQRPPFVDECGIKWEELVDKYDEELKEEQSVLFQEENGKYLDAIDKLTNEEISEFESDGVIPKSLTTIVTLGSDMHFRFIKIPDKCPSTGGYIFDDISRETMFDTVDDFEEREAK